MDGAELEALSAAESPVGGSEASDEHFLNDAAWLDLVAEVGDEGVEVGGILGAVAAENDDLAGAQAVLEGVLGGAGLAFGGPRSGGPASVFAVGLKLFFGNAFWHGDSPVRGAEKAPSVEITCRVIGSRCEGSDQAETQKRRNAKTRKGTWARKVLVSGPGRIRTCDQTIMSRLL